MPVPRDAFPLAWLYPTLDRCRQEFRHGVPLPRSKINGLGNVERVTDLDLLVEEHLIQACRQNFPDSGVLSEETESDPAALRRDVCFVIDPIDGTNELIAGRGDYAISVAVFVNGEPAAAVLDLPARDQRFSCHAGRGTFVNGRPITLPARVSRLAQARLAVSPGQRGDPTLQARWGLVEARAFHPVGALTPKVADVLLGHCDAALYLPWPDHLAFIWDYAAAALLLREAGGTIVGTDGVELLDSLPLRHHVGWIAGERRLCDEIRAAVC